MRILKKTLKILENLRYKEIKKEKSILYETSMMSLPVNMPEVVYFISFFKEEGFKIHSICSSIKLNEYKYLKNIVDKFLPFKVLGTVLKYLPFIIYMHAINFRKYMKIKNIFNLEINGIYIGDAIYDEYLRFNQQGTVKRLNWKLFIKISEAFYFYFYLKNIYKTYDYEYVVVNHHCYIRQLLMIRMAIKLNIKVIYNDSIFVVKKLYSSSSLENEHTHTPSNRIIKKAYTDTKLMDKLYQKQSIVLLRNLDIAYYEKNDDDKDFIKKIKKIKKANSKKIVVIYAHVYTDNITSSNGKRFVFMDHYLWVKNTLMLCANNPNIITILKSHPAESYYKNSITSETIFKEVQNELNNENLILCPENIDLKKYPDLVDLVITSRGTIGVEMPCLGVPVLAQVYNQAVFSNNEIVIESRNYEDYAKSIKNAHLIPKLNLLQIKKAIAFAKLLNILVFYTNKDVVLSFEDVKREGHQLMSLAEIPEAEIENAYDENIDEILSQHIVNFFTNHKDNFFKDMKIFLYDDDIMHLAEVNYQDNLEMLTSE